MPTDFHHGVRVIEINEGERTIRTVATAIIGLVATAPDADGDMFPVDTPVLITNIHDKLALAGELGTLRSSLQAISDQANAIVVVVRVEEGEDAEETTANVIGTTTSAGRTGMQALLDSKTQLKVVPRILGAPGLDTEAVAVAFATVAQKLRARAYVYADGCDTVVEALAYRDQFAAREITVLWPHWQGFDVVSASTVEIHSPAVAMGCRAAIDETQGWHKTLSNVAINGVTGISKSVYWDLQDPNTDAGLLNAGGVVTLIHSTGYRFWGNQTCSDDPLFAFESAARTAQILADTIAEGVMWAIDKPLHASLARDIIASINAKFRALKAQGYIIDAKAWLDPAANTQGELAAGKLIIDYDYTPVPPLENLMLRQRITDKYLADFAVAVNGS